MPASVPALLAPVQGTSSLRERDGDRVTATVRRALEAHGYDASFFRELVGRALVACQTPECIERALDAAGAAFAIVPAIWSRESGGQEVTLTLVQRSGRSLNATGAVAGDLEEVTVSLVEGLLARRVGSGAGTATAAGAVRATEAAGGGADRGRPHAWKAGPVILVAGGAAAIVAIGVAAGVKRDDQQLNTSAAAAWAAVGAAAIGGGVAWWVMGQKRRRKSANVEGALAAELGLHPTKIDLTLRF
ncbi:MAG: hypothetical protein HKP50_19950 [Myxococcales bacterium]|nr:hypothetical protein [Myxococcales bacterium]